MGKAEGWRAHSAARPPRGLARAVSASPMGAIPPATMPALLVAVPASLLA